MKEAMIPVSEALRFYANAIGIIANAAEDAAIVIAERGAHYCQIAPGDGTLYQFYLWFPATGAAQIVAGTDPPHLLDPNGQGWHDNYVSRRDPLTLPYVGEGLCENPRWKWLPDGNHKTQAVIAYFVWCLTERRREMNR